MSNIPAISEWRRVFIDTSFILDLVRDISVMSPEDPKYQAVERSQKLLEHFKLVAEKNEKPVRWITCSIVLSELIKFENEEAIEELQKILNSAEVEIINFTGKEANFIVSEMGNYIEEKHIAQFLREVQRELGKSGIFNPRGYVSKDALIIACAKSKRCDVVITSDKNSFVPIAKKVQLPILLSKDIPLSLHGDVNFSEAIPTNY